MLKVAMGNGNTSKGPKVDFEPDRTGSFFGLSMSGFHPVAYTDWGAANTRIPVVCVHGLSRQGRDFDYLAAHLAGAGRRVVCPDLVGRGQSGRLRDPNEYALPQYCADMNALIAALDAGQVDWVGTSLGGLIGIVLAGLPGNPIRRLVINDIAPYLPWAGLARIGSYISAMPVDFHDLGEAEAYFREVLYQIPEIVTPRRFPNQLSSDSTWRTLEVRHVGSDTFARGLRCGAAAWLGEEDEGWAAGSTASGSCGDL